MKRIKKFSQLILVMALGFAFCGCNRTREWTNPLDPSNPTPTPVPTSFSQLIWQNGTVGCWAGNCSTGAILVGGQHVTISNYLEFSDNSAIFAPLTCGFTIGNTQNATAYSSGHLEFDIRLAQPVALYSQIAVYTTGGNVYLTPSSLNSSTFTHVSIPLASLGVNSSDRYLGSFSFTMTTNIGINSPYADFNNVGWTLN